MRIVDRVDTPFKYFLADQCLKPELQAELLLWFENGAPWRLVNASFYDQYEFSMLHSELPEGIRGLISEKDLCGKRRAVEEAFGCRLATKTNVVAHKLTAGQRIAIHNDFLPDGETHRLTIQLNRGLSEEDGGFFMLFNSFDPEDVHRILRPISNTAIGFEITKDSQHAVSTLHGGTRFTLVYSFFAE